MRIEVSPVDERRFDAPHRIDKGHLGVALLNLDEEDGPVAGNRFRRALEHLELVSLDVYFDEVDVGQRFVVEPAGIDVRAP